MKFGRYLSVLAGALVAYPAIAQTVDGQITLPEYVGGNYGLQRNYTEWGPDNRLNALYARLTMDHKLYVAFAGRTENNGNGNAMGLFVDYRSGGQNVIDSMSNNGFNMGNLFGLTLPTGMDADLYYRFNSYWDGVSSFNLYTNECWMGDVNDRFLGNMGQGVLSQMWDGSTQRGIAFADYTGTNGVTGDPQTTVPEQEALALTSDKGLEICIDLTTLPNYTPGQPIKLWAILGGGGGWMSAHAIGAYNNGTSSPGNSAPNASALGATAINVEPAYKLNGYQVNYGVEISAPGMSNLIFSDGDAVSLAQNLDQEDPNPCQVEFAGTASTATPSSLTFNIIGRAEANDREIYTEFFNFTLGDWVGVPSVPVTDSDALYSFSASGLASDYVSSLQVIARVTGFLGAADTPTLATWSFNMVWWN